VKGGRSVEAGASHSQYLSPGKSSTKRPKRKTDIPINRENFVIFFMIHSLPVEEKLHAYASLDGVEFDAVDRSG
jgi:hypothetical protein